MNKKIIAFLIVSVALISFTPILSVAAEPVSKTLALPGGAVNTNAWAYMTGENRSAYTSFLLAHAVIKSAQAIDNTATVTLSHVRNAATNAIYAFTVASNGTSALFFPTNMFYWMRGDTLVATFSATNAATLNLTVLEQ